MKISVGNLRKLVREEKEHAAALNVLFGKVNEAPTRRPDAKSIAIERLKRVMKLTTFDKYNYIVPKDNTIKSPVTLSISTYGLTAGEGSMPAHLEVTSYGGGVNKHKDTPGNGAYRVALRALWDTIYPGGQGDLAVDDAIQMWPAIEELLCVANEEKAELEKVKLLPRETPVQKKYMDYSYTNEDQFIKAAAEHLLFVDAGQEPWSVDRDAYVDEYGEEEFYEALKDYASDAHAAIVELIDNDEPATMRNLEKHMKSGSKRVRPRRT